jgi:segregation and condensation protein B
MEGEKLKSIVEGMVFASAEPVAARDIAHALREDPSRIQAILEELDAEYASRNRGFHLQRAAGGFQFRTLSSIAPWIWELRRTKPVKPRRATLETVAIVAYNQPVTKATIERIRGVESTAPLRSLLEREWIEVVGRKESVGRPLLYAVTPRFLEAFGLPDLSALPPLPELERIDGEIDAEEGREDD